MPARVNENIYTRVYPIFIFRSYTALLFILYMYLRIDYATRGDDTSKGFNRTVRDSVIHIYTLELNRIAEDARVVVLGLSRDCTRATSPLSDH